MREIMQKSAIPVYSAALPWLLGALLLPFYKLWHFALAALFSIAIYFVMSRVIPPKRIMVKVEQPPANTGNADADAVINEGRVQVERLQELDDAIADERVSAHVVRIGEICGKIFDYLAERPQKAPQLRLFLRYYLPTTLKLLESYRRMAGQNISGENISSAMRGVEGILSTIEEAFEKQLDHLFADEALDISTDITVLEGMMAREGLVKDDLQSSNE